jgi:predicted helicase
LERIHATIAYFNSLVDRGNSERGDAPDSSVQDISWSRGLIARLKREARIDFDQHSLTISAYRPFQKQFLYSDPAILERPGPLMNVHPGDQENFGFQITAPGSGHPFSVLAVANVPDLAFWGSGGAQYFPRFSFEIPKFEGELDIFNNGQQRRRIDNVSDAVLQEYQKLYGREVTKDEIFAFTYGLLHSPDYRLSYASDLKKLLPRLPKLTSEADFTAFSAAGQELLSLHLNYEAVDHFPLIENVIDQRSLRVSKLKFAGKAGAWDKSTIIYNSTLTLRGIPDEAHEYMLGSRSAIEWILERYQVKTDKDSGIVNDPNLWGEEHGNPSYILDLLKSIVTVSVETVRIVKSLPKLNIRAD